MMEPEAELDVLEEFPLEGDEVILAGIEIHAHIIQENGNPKIIFTYLPTVRNRELPEVMTEFNSMIEMVCRKTVAVFPEESFARFYTVLKKSGGADRCHCRQVNFENMPASPIFITKLKKCSKLYARA